MIKPTVGRMVHFHPARGDPIVHDGVQPLSGQIAYVHNDRLVNLGVLDKNGVLHPRTSVPLLQDDDAAQAGTAHAKWMDYQRGQAAKTEALERQIADAGAEAKNPSTGAAAAPSG